MTLIKLEKILLFLTLLFLPTQLGRHFWPSFSYIYSLKIDYFSPTFYFWDVLVLGLILTWILSKPKVNKLALNLLLFFLLTQSLSLLGAQNMGAGLVRLEQYVVAGLFGLYLASYQLPVTSYFLPLALGVLFESGLAIMQFIKGGTIGFWILGERSFSLTTPGIAKFNFQGFEFLRPYGTFPHPNVLAGYLLVLIYNLQFTIYNWKAKKTFFRIIVFMLSAAIALTVSRVAILAGFILGFFTLPKKWKLVLVAVVVLLSPVLFTRFEVLFNYDNLTFFRREELLQSSWNLFVKSPIFGVGLNNFIPAQSSDLVSGPSRFLQPVHNIFLLALSETGLVGFLGLIILFFPVFKLRTIRYTLYAILFLGFFDHYFLTLPQGYRLLFLIWGLSLSQLKLK